MNKNVHVAPSNGGWTVAVDGNARARRFLTRREATQMGRRLARANRADYVLHAHDGRIRQRDSYGRDPFSTRG